MSALNTMGAQVTGSWRSLKTLVLTHKIWSALVAIVVLWGLWWGYGVLTSTAGQVRYVLGTVQTGSIVSSVSESGQVSTSNSLSIQPQVSGPITWVGVAVGDHVQAGQAIASISDTSLVQSINDAKQQLASDELQYQENSAQAPVTYQNDVTTLATANENLQNDYNSTFNDIGDTYLDLPAVMTGANDVLYGYDFDTKKEQWNLDFLTSLFNSTQNTASVTGFKSAAESDYATANTSYTTAVAAYQQVTRTSSTATIDTLLTQSVAMTTDVAQALQSELNFYGAISDLAQTYNVHLPSNFATLQASTRSYLTATNSDLSTLLADQNTLNTAKQSITDDQQAITLAQVGNNSQGANPISLQIEEASITKEKVDLANQEATLAEYTVTAPFSGTISALTAQVGGDSGSSVATIVSDTQVADLSVNEVDAAKIALGDKATLTFDALPSLTLTGTVAEVDPVGTVSQGVVTYSLEITLDAQNSQVKPGMTMSANIQTAAHENTLLVPSGAVKTQNGMSYVQIFNPPIASSTIAAAGSQGVLSTTPPQSVPVTTGLTDDVNVEILSGLTAGEQIVESTKTVTTKSTATPAATTGAARAGGGFGGGGGFAGGGGGGAVLRGI